MSSRPPPGADHHGDDAALARNIATLQRALSLDHSGCARALPLPSSSPAAEQARHKRRRLKSISSSSSFRKLLPSSASSSASTTSTSSSSSFWKTAVSYLGRRRLDCAFTLHVHSADGLPSSLDGAPISVQFRRPPASASARPVLAAHGAAAFEEALTLRSAVHFSRGARGAAVRYEPRAFTVSVFAAALDLGKHGVDLTRLLPLSFHDLADGGDAPGFGKWSTSFRLSGPARGARLHVTFSCAVVGEQQHKGTEVAGLRRHGSTMARPVSALDCEDEGSPEAKHCTSVEEVIRKGDLVHPEDDHDFAEFSIVDYGIEYATDDPERFKHVGRRNVADHAVQLEFEELFCNEYEAVELKTGEDAIDVAVQWEIVRDRHDKELEDLESMFSNLSFVVVDQDEFDSPTVEDKLSRRLSCTSEHDSYYKSATSRKGRSRSTDASSDHVTREFLDMFGIEHSPFGRPSDGDPESPRERLWKQFEMEALASGNSVLGLDFNVELEGPVCEDVVDLSAIIHEAELELQNARQPVDTLRFQATQASKIAGR